MHRPPARTSRRLESLIDERDHLRVTISLEADRAEASPERLMALSKRLDQVERAITAERRELKNG